MSEQLLNVLVKRKEYLEDVISKKEKALGAVPGGNLRTSSINGHYRYYHVTEKRTNGLYLTKDKMEIAEALAQRDYDREVLASGERELKTLDELIIQQSISVEDVYQNLSPARKPLVNPIRLPDDEYVAQWLESKRCEPMGFTDSDPVIITAGGYRVRSKSEQMWADAFEEFGVPHYFEPLLYLEGHGWVRPDFAGLNVRRRKEIIVEHFGMMDVFSYSDTNVQKLHDYERNGFVLGDDLLITMETKKYPPDRRSIEGLIKKHFL